MIHKNSKKISTMRQIKAFCNSVVPSEWREVATMLVAERNALAKQAENEKSPSPTNNIFWELE